ncbi:MAG: hypothetical protein WAK32_03630 [Xanthobacteraceae bacterium]
MTEPVTITLDWVRAEKAKHKAAIADLEATERVLLLRQNETALSMPVHEHKLADGYGAKKHTLLSIIANAKQGLTTQELIVSATNAGLAGLKVENTSPQLSTYKSRDGLLDLRNGRWQITLAGMNFLADKNREQP